MAVSALLTGGIGPWLPFQMIAAGWIGLLAGFAASKVTPAFERFYLIILGILSSLGFGLLMDLQLWPWLTSTDTQLSFVPGAGVAENLERFLVFHLTTALAWDIPRALTTALLIALTAKPILNSLKRARTRLNFTSHVKVQKVIA